MRSRSSNADTGVEEGIDRRVAGPDLADREVRPQRLEPETLVRDRRPERLDVGHDAGASFEWMGPVFCTHESTCDLAAQIRFRTFNVHGPIFKEKCWNLLDFLVNGELKI